ncbi:unnamed protein product [Arctia plantaginis]|uniref:Uncharacterized protein n=1 Tax=Arctia plantaginis TaxID=874455 RepID=A0A8S1B0F1_ARCPL|nr:unnamed protein product [Arctia plantaginis]
MNLRTAPSLILNKNYYGVVKEKRDFRVVDLSIVAVRLVINIILLVISGKMSYSRYVLIEPDQRLAERHDQFTDNLNVKNPEPVKVYEMSQRVLDELKLIKEISATLQEKKKEYIEKVMQAAEEAKENAKEAVIKGAEEQADMAVKEY